MGDSPACLCSWLAGGKCELAISSCCIWQLQQVFQQTSSASSGEGSLLPKVFQLLKMVWEYFINFEWHGNWLTLLYLLCYGSSCVSSLLLYCHLVLWLPNVILAVIFLMLLTILLFFLHVLASWVKSSKTLSSSCWWLCASGFSSMAMGIRGGDMQGRLWASSTGFLIYKQVNLCLMYVLCFVLQACR